jgi:hypothetical protein
VKLGFQDRGAKTFGLLFVSLATVVLGLGFAWPTLLSGAPARVGATPRIPVGTTLPITLEHELSSKDLAKGERIEGRLMQEVDLPGGEKIPAGAKLHGMILAVVPEREGGASITFRIDSLESRHSTIPIVVALRAMATLRAVQAAQAPYGQAIAGSPAEWATTLQIGGDRRYGSGGKVTNRRGRKVGKALADGGVLARLEEAPGSPCAGWPNEAGPVQAVWVFSADACGLYDLKDMHVARAGNSGPFGEITLSKQAGEIKIMKSSAMLLRVVK